MISSTNRQISQPAIFKTVTKPSVGALHSPKKWYDLNADKHGAVSWDGAKSPTAKAAKEGIYFFRKKETETSPEKRKAGKTDRKRKVRIEEHLGKINKGKGGSLGKRIRLSIKNKENLRDLFQVGFSPYVRKDTKAPFYLEDIERELSDVHDTVKNGFNDTACGGGGISSSEYRKRAALMPELPKTSFINTYFSSSKPSPINKSVNRPVEEFYLKRNKKKSIYVKMPSNVGNLKNIIYLWSIKGKPYKVGFTGQSVAGRLSGYFNIFDETLRKKVEMHPETVSFGLLEAVPLKDDPGVYEEKYIKALGLKGNKNKGGGGSRAMLRPDKALTEISQSIRNVSSGKFTQVTVLRKKT